MAVTWLVLPNPVVTTGWALLGIAVSELFGLAGTAVLALALARTLTFDMNNAALWNGLSERVLSSLPLIAPHSPDQFLAYLPLRRDGRRILGRRISDGGRRPDR